MSTPHTTEIHPGDRVRVYRESAFCSVETAVVLEVHDDLSLRLQYPDGHRSPWRHGRVELVAAAGR